jgi:hypothetical protein
MKKALVISAIVSNQGETLQARIELAKIYQIQKKYNRAEKVLLECLTIKVYVVQK